MNTKEYMIITKDGIKTSDIVSCDFNSVTDEWHVKFNNRPTIYRYKQKNIKVYTNPLELNPTLYKINREGQELFNIKDIYEFGDKSNEYWHICFQDGTERDYRKCDLNIVESCLSNDKAAHVFEYIKKIAGLSEIKDEDTGEKILAKIYEKNYFMGKDVALAKYLNPKLIGCGKKNIENNIDKENLRFLIFPFGCNNSQYKAVENAMENQISVIQGPPGTGKTQTILNIISNILLEGKTVLVVSNNNAATENVYEKLASDDYNLGFIAATLGKVDNKKAFIKNQDKSYPDFTKWLIKDNTYELRNEIYEKSNKLKKFFDIQEKLASLKQELSEILTEKKYFNQYVEETNADNEIVRLNKKLTSKRWMELWQECQSISEKEKAIGFWFRVKMFFKFGITDLKIYVRKIPKMIITFQANYYSTKKNEIENEIIEIEKYIENNDTDIVKDFSAQSMVLLKDSLARKYSNNKTRQIFDEDDLWKRSEAVLHEYPVILSTTFSSRNSLNKDTVYDYLIMDEASQVDIATGALALSCAKNVVIVGDTKQLPNVVNNENRVKADKIFNKYSINDGYKFTNSFLQSVLEIIPEVPQTLLKEHYRCHPKIINYCNQKFYGGELLIMTEDKGESDVLSVIKTAKGNHAHDHINQREIDVIKKEVIPQYNFDLRNVGIIAPYRNQVGEMANQIPAIEVDTVHKFQGREKDTIIISTVDNEISDFADDPFLINVAVSRAKKKLMLVVTGNELQEGGNVKDLVDYIEYNNFNVTESKIYSIFDYLYKQYTKERIEYLSRKKKISEYDSENLMYHLIKEILESRYKSLDVVCHFPMKMLIRDPKYLDDNLCRYAMNPRTHLDFLIYNKTSKKPVLAIEVDGYAFHKAGSKQAERDKMKNEIMEKYSINLLRCKTTGSGEKEIIINQLESIINKG